MAFHLRLRQVEMILRRYAAARESTFHIASLDRGFQESGSGERTDLEFLGTVAWGLKRLPQRISVVDFEKLAGGRLWDYLEPMIGRRCKGERFSMAEAWAFVDRAFVTTSNRLTSSRVVLALAHRRVDPVVERRAVETVRELGDVVDGLRALRDTIYEGPLLMADFGQLQSDSSFVELWREGRR